jgi:hypothetical protein
MEASSVGSSERTAEAPEEDNMDTSQNGNETNFRHLDEEKLSLEKNMVPEEAVDLPALLLAAYLLQHTGDLLSYVSCFPSFQPGQSQRLIKSYRSSLLSLPMIHLIAC